MSNNDTAPIKLENIKKHFKKFPTIIFLIANAKESYSIQHEIDQDNELLSTPNRGLRTYTIYNDYKPHYIQITHFYLAFSSLQSILFSNDYRTKPIKKFDHILGANLCSQLSDPFINDNNYFDFLGRIYFEQFRWQSFDMQKELTRSLYLFSEIYQDDKFSSKYNFNTDIKILTSLNTYEIIYNSLLLYTFYTTGHFTFELDRVKQFFDIGKDINISNILKLIDLLNTDYLDLRDTFREINQNNSDQSMYKYSFNPLEIYPIITPDKNKKLRIITNAALFAHRITSQIYWLIREKYNQDGSYKFLNEFGNHFDFYIGKQIERYFINALNIINLDNYKKEYKITARIADWIIEIDDYYIVIETKSSIAPLKVQTQFTSKVLHDWLKQTIFKSIKQLESTSNLFPFDKNKTIYNIVLTYDNLLNFTFGDFLKQLPANTLENLYFITLNEFEGIETGIKEIGLDILLQEKQRIIDSETRVDGEDLLYIQSKLGINSTNNSFLDNLFDKTFQQLFEKTFPEKTGI